MIVIYYNTGDNLFVKKYDGDEYELIAAEQTFTNGAKKANCSFTLKTDLGEVINIVMPIEFNKDEVIVKYSVIISGIDVGTFVVLSNVASLKLAVKNVVFLNSFLIAFKYVSSVLSLDLIVISGNEYNLFILDTNVAILK